MKRTTVILATLLATLSPAAAARAELSGPITGFEAITYQPKNPAAPKHPAEPKLPPGHPSSLSQFHAGFFSPSEVSSTGLVLGFRAGMGPDEHVVLGVDFDWHYKSESQTSIESLQPLPGGGTAQVKRVLSSASSNLFPMLAFLQLSGGRSMAVIPYAGVGVGYEAYFLSGNDYNSGAHFDAEYGGFAWQAWAGAQLPLSWRSRLVAEAFMNQADLGRDVWVYGIPYRESVNLNGGGMRFGVNWGF
jgi:hypothetical protein